MIGVIVLDIRYFHYIKTHMDSFKTIPESIEELSQGEIQKKRKKRIIPILCIILGFPIIWWGIVKWTTIGSEQTSYLLVFVGLFLIGWGSVLLALRTQYFVLVKTGEEIKPQKVYLDPSKQEIVKQLLDDGRLEEVLKHTIKTRSPLMLELWQVDGHRLLYSQLLLSHNSKNSPISDVKTINKENSITT